MRIIATYTVDTFYEENTATSHHLGYRYTWYQSPTPMRWKQINDMEALIYDVRQTKQV